MEYIIEILTDCIARITTNKSKDAIEVITIRTVLLKSQIVVVRICIGCIQVLLYYPLAQQYFIHRMRKVLNFGCTNRQLQQQIDFHPSVVAVAASTRT